MPCFRIGSIASSGKPPLPQIARTPYFAPSGSVKRTIRPVVVDRSVGGDVRRGASCRPALVVDGDGVQRHVRVGVLDVALEDGDVAAEAHRADSGLVQELVQLLLELRDD